MLNFFASFRSLVVFVSFVINITESRWEGEAKLGSWPKDLIFPFIEGFVFVGRLLIRLGKCVFGKDYEVLVVELFRVFYVWLLLCKL